MNASAGGEGRVSPPRLRVSRERAAFRLRPSDATVRRTVFGLSLLPPIALIGITLVVAWWAWPALRYSGISFLTGRVFTFGSLYSNALSVHNGVTAPHGATYGILPILVGTLASSVLALALAIPIAVGAALVVVERIPVSVQWALSSFIELLAGIPSVVYGLWGIIAFGPLMAHHVYPVIARAGAVVPFLRGPVGAGEGLLTSALILAVMVIPIIASTARELIRSVPTLQREGAIALGLTPFETVKVVVFPFVRNGILAASLLGWARALGETMAVLMLSGDALNIYPSNLYAPISTLAATIAAMLDGALTDATRMSVHALAAAGLVLLLITLVTNLAGRAIVRRARVTSLPVGRGF